MTRMSSLGERAGQWRREAVYRLREWYDRWRALPLRTRGGIAAGLMALMVVCLSLSLWLFLSRGRAAHGEEPSGEVVLYTSVDAPIARPVVEAFERSSGLRVRLVTDTEATKTTGLVERVIAEKDRPRCDVWWSNEALGSIALARAGVLEPFASKAEAALGGRWPGEYRAADRTWYGFALRARVIAFHSGRIARANAPTRLRDLTRAEWSGKVGMARPQFGTTRMHVAALLALHGEQATREFLVALRDNGLRLYDGNSAVVRAISNGEVEVGLTDTDDVLAARREQWPVDFCFEAVDKPNAPRARGLPSVGPIVIPSTVGMVRGCPHPNEARRLTDYLLSAAVEEMLANSDARTVPIRADLAKKVGVPLIPEAAGVRMDDIGPRLGQADRLIGEVFPLP